MESKEGKETREKEKDNWLGALGGELREEVQKTSQKEWISE